jgi:hypothetical protein
MNELFSDISFIPNIKSVYLVIHPESTKTPNFLKVGSGGHFKGKNPNVSLEELQSN